MATTVNSIGLILDIVGGLLLFKFGLPPKIDPQGHIHLTLVQVDEDEIKTAKRYGQFSQIAVILIIIGFLLQLASNYLP